MNHDNQAIAKIRMMNDSLVCLVFGLLALLPFIGVPFALVAFWSSYSARKREQTLWNPAKPHRQIGLVCAAFGALIWCLVDTVWIYHAVFEM